MTILTVTLNPALDISTDVERVVSGTKLRCAPARLDAGGGGVNVSRAITKLGGDSTAFAVIGGPTGEMFKDLVEGEGVPAIWFKVDALTRQSMMVYELSTRQQYRFVLPGPEWSVDQAERVLEGIKEALRTAGQPITHVVGSGSLPRGVSDSFYDQIGAAIKEAGAQFVLDTSGAALKVAAGGSENPPHIWIMDQAEAESIAGRKIADLDALETLARDLRGRDDANVVILSFGEGGAVAVSDDEVLRMMPPKVKVISKVGAGDSFVAGLVLRLVRGASLREALAYAVATAASAVTTPATQLCDGAQTDRYFNMIMNGET